jgi:hypothetical protein
MPSCAWVPPGGLPPLRAAFSYCHLYSVQGYSGTLGAPVQQASPLWVMGARQLSETALGCVQGAVGCMRSKGADAWGHLLWARGQMRVL